MDLVERLYAPDTDPVRIAELVCAVPPTTRHTVDYPWRLSSPLLNPAEDARLWLVDDVLVGYAAWRVWWATLDVYLRPGSFQEEVETAVFDWAGRRFRALDAERGQPLPYWVEAREDDMARVRLLARIGYTLEDEYTYVMLSRPLVEPPALPKLPTGFTIRPLAGERDVAAYVDVHRRAFASTSMTLDWRLRTLSMPHYEPGLDLVAVAPSGQVVGFCVGWTDSAHRVGQIEPLGVDPAFNGHGLGRALLLEMLGRFRAYGAAHAQVETDSGRIHALRAYEAVGFLPAYRSVRRGQWFTRPVNA
jgi:mycothiol synthase